MLSDFITDWKNDLKVLWATLVAHILLYYKYTFWFDYQMREYYKDRYEQDLRDIAAHVVKLVEHYATQITDAIEEWVLDLMGWDSKPAVSVDDQITNLWDSITSLWATFGGDLLTGEYTVETWVEDKLEGVWDSITAIWTKFGWQLNNSKMTVVEWIEDIATGVVSWVQTNYDGAKTQAQAATDWIADHGKKAATWVENWGWRLDYWYVKHGGFYAYLFNQYRGLLMAFLEDPQGFIGAIIEEYLEGTEERPGQPWFKKLIDFLFNPIGTLLEWVIAGQKILWDWLIEWMAKNFGTLEEMIESIEPPDTYLPDVSAWLKGLREPETEEELAYATSLEQSLEYVIKGTLPDNPPMYWG